MAVAACTGPAEGPEGGRPASLAAFYGQSVTWTECGTGLHCAKVTVPIDYSAPTGKTTTLSLVRLTNKGARDTLMVDPATGFGPSGVDYVRAAYSALTPKLALGFDIVGFDPRGVGESEPVRCLSDAQMDQFLAADWTPDTPAEVSALATLSQAFRTACTASAPDLVAHMGTTDTARDMDIIRSLLGSPHLNFLGSYNGTALGAEYARLFPSNVGHMVLDGPVPRFVAAIPRQSSDVGDLTMEELNAQQARSFDQALRLFLSYCLTSEYCPMEGTVTSAVARIQKFLQDLDAVPLPAAPGRPLTEALATTAMSVLLLDKQRGWQTLRTALASAFGGDGAGLVQIVDSSFGRRPDGTYRDNKFQANYVTACTDSPMAGTAAHVAELAKDWQRLAHVFGPSQAWMMLPCWGWPPPAQEPAAPTAGSDAVTVLLVATLDDPVTPYPWAIQMMKELRNPALLTYAGDGHPAYNRGSPCVDAAVENFLIEGVLPPSQASCPSTR